MRSTRISVTLERKVADELRRVAGPCGVSAFVNEAVKQRLQAIRLRRLLDELEQEHGPIPAAVQAEVDKPAWPD